MKLYQRKLSRSLSDLKLEKNTVSGLSNKIFCQKFPLQRSFIYSSLYFIETFYWAKNHHICGRETQSIHPGLHIWSCVMFFINEKPYIQTNIHSFSTKFLTDTHRHDQIIFLKLLKSCVCDKYFSTKKKLKYRNEKQTKSNCLSS